MIAATCKRHSDSTLLGCVHRCTQCVHTDQWPDAVITVYEAQSGCWRLHGDPRLGTDTLDKQPVAVRLNA